MHGFHWDSFTQVVSPPKRLSGQTQSNRENAQGNCQENRESGLAVWLCASPPVKIRETATEIPTVAESAGFATFPGFAGSADLLDLNDPVVSGNLTGELPPTTRYPTPLWEHEAEEAVFVPASSESGGLYFACACLRSSDEYIFLKSGFCEFDHVGSREPITAPPINSGPPRGHHLPLL